MMEAHMRTHFPTVDADDVASTADMKALILNS